jgi:hypothetical protein
MDASPTGAEPGQDVAAGGGLEAVEQHTQLGELTGREGALDLVAAHAANVNVHEAVRAVAACRLAVVDGEVLDRDLLIAVDAGRFHFEFDQLAKIGQRVVERGTGLQGTWEKRRQDPKTQASTAGNQGGEGV